MGLMYLPMTRLMTIPRTMGTRTTLTMDMNMEYRDTSTTAPAYSLTSSGVSTGATSVEIVVQVTLRGTSPLAT